MDLKLFPKAKKSKDCSLFRVQSHNVSLFWLAYCSFWGIIMVTNAGWEVTGSVGQNAQVNSSCLGTYLLCALREKLHWKPQASPLDARGAGLYWSAENCIIWQGNKVAKSSLPAHHNNRNAVLLCHYVVTRSARLLATHHCCNGLVLLKCGIVKCTSRQMVFFPMRLPLSLPTPAALRSYNLLRVSLGDGRL